METIQQTNKQEILGLILADMRNRKLYNGTRSNRPPLRGFLYRPRRSDSLQNRLPQYQR